MAAPASTLKFHLEEFFPKDAYKGVCSKNKKLTPHFLIALGQSKAAIMPWIEKYPEYKDPGFGLSCFAVATLAQNHELMEELLKRKDVDPKTVDFALLTPLHYAEALQDRKSILLIRTALKCQDIAAPSFPAWKKMFNPPIPADNEIVYEYKNGKGKVVPGTAAEFKEQTGATFYEGLVATPSAWLASLAERIKEPGLSANGVILSVGKKLRPALSQFHAKQPRLYLGGQQGTGLGVFAGQTIRRGQVCSLYGGEIDSHRQVNDYTFANVDSEKIRNLGAMINDGFPNLLPWPISLEDGQFLDVFVALEDLPENAPLFWNYGASHQIKYKNYHLVNGSQMTEYFRVEGPYSRMKGISNEAERCAKGSSNTFEAEIEWLGIQVRVGYLLHTPRAIFDLVLNGAVKREEIAGCLKLPNTFALLNIQNEVDHENHLQFLELLLENLETLEKLLKYCNNAELKKEFLSEIFRLLEVHGARFLVNYMMLDFSYPSIEDWKARNETTSTNKIEAIAILCEKFSAREPSRITDDYITKCAEALGKTPYPFQRSIQDAFSSIAEQDATKAAALLKIFERMQN